MEKARHACQRVGIFVDVSNMYFSAKNLYDKKTNFDNILKEAVGKRKLVRAFAYVVEGDSGKEQDFFQALSDQGYEVRSKPLQVFRGGAKKGDWDVGLTIDVVRSLPLLDVVVVVSGDGDYIDLLDYVRGHGRRTEIMAFGQSASGGLIEESDEFIDLSENKKKFLI